MTKWNGHGGIVCACVCVVDVNKLLSHPYVYQSVSCARHARDTAILVCFRGQQGTRGIMPNHHRVSRGDHATHVSRRYTWALEYREIFIICISWTKLLAHILLPIILFLSGAYEYIEECVCVCLKFWWSVFRWRKRVHPRNTERELGARHTLCVVCRGER